MLFQRILNIYERISTKDISDEFIIRLRQVNPGLLNLGNLLCFNHAVAYLPTQAPILEIGSFCGLSTNCINYYKKIHGVSNKIITCDRWNYSFKGLGEEPIGKSSITGTEWAKFVKETFIKNIQFFCTNDLPWAVEAYSDELFEWWETDKEVLSVFEETITLGGKISFCYIDGNHEYNQVKRDFENCHQYLDMGGFILFDDSADISGSPGVKKLISELKKNRIIGTMYELVMKNPNYLIKKCKDGYLNYTDNGHKGAFSKV